jgi:serine protease Do
MPQKARRAVADFSSEIEEIARVASPAVVQITVHSRAPVDAAEGRRTSLLAQQQSTGSGVVVDAAGYIVTNAHVVDGARSIDVSVIDPSQKENDGHRHFAAALVGIDKETDLAVLKVDGSGLPTLQFVDSDKLRQGQVVLALGSPLGLDNSLTVGFISAPHRHLRPNQPMHYIQTDAPINPGNSGGPLLDVEGRVAGLNTLIMSQSGGSEGIGFSIPANMVKQVYQQLRAEGRVRRGAVGILSDGVTPLLAKALGLPRDSGIIISDVVPHGSAEAAGLRTGDIITGVDGKPALEAQEVVGAIFQHKVGDEVAFDILRGTEKLVVKVAIVERKNSPASLAEMADRDDNLVRQLGVLAMTLDEKVTAVLPDLRRLSGVAVAAIPAEYAGLNPGLAPGDVIYELNGKALASLAELHSELSQRRSGAAIALLVEREGRLIYVPFELE